MHFNGQYKRYSHYLSLQQYEREIRLAAGSGLPDSIDLCLNRLNMEPGSTYAVGPSVDYNYIEGLF